MGKSYTLAVVREAHERAYRTSVDAQRTTDATGIPHLSSAAEAAIDVVAAEPDEKIRGETWKAVQKDEWIAAELETMRKCGVQRTR